MPNKIINIAAVILITLIVILGAAGGYYYFKINGQGGDGEAGAETSPSLPIGQEREIGIEQQDDFQRESNGGVQSGSSTDNYGYVSEDIVKLSANPVAGYSVLNIGTTSMIAWVDRYSGHIYSSHKNSADEPKKLSNTTISGVQESHIGSVKKKIYVLMRYMNGQRVSNFLASLTVPTATTTDESVLAKLTGDFMEGDIITVVLSPLKDKLFYLTRKGNGSAGYILDLDSSKKKIAFESPLYEWEAIWNNNSSVILYTKPSANIKGVVYSLNATDYGLKKIMGGINGLAVLPSPDGKKLLFSSVNGAYVLNIGAKQVQSLTVKTSPEKCVWSLVYPEILYCGASNQPSGPDYPDGWYKGFGSFKDKIWAINADNNEADILFDPGKNNLGTMDIINLSLDKEEKNLFFMNKNDLSLWQYKLSREGGV